MKLFLLLLHFTVMPYLLRAAQPFTDTVPQGRQEILKELELTNEQKAAIKLLLVEYKMKERSQKNELRQKIIAVLSAKQRRKLRRILHHPL